MCRIEDADSDGWWLIEPHDVKARKDHNCGDCGRTIAKGETYTYGSWADGGTVLAMKMCAQCVVAGHWLMHVCGGHFWPGVVEELREHWEEDTVYRSVGLGRLIIGAKRHWRRNGQLIPIEQVSGWVDSALEHVPSLA